jgi:hypothetical protein
LALPEGVRLVTWTIWMCFGRHSRCQIGYMDYTGCLQLVFLTAKERE